MLDTYYNDCTLCVYESHNQMKLGLGFIFSPQIPDSSAKSPVELMRFLHVYVSSIQIVLANKRDLNSTE